jgi:hypothetical protein
MNFRAILISIITVFFSHWVCIGYAQQENKPLAPFLNVVTVDPLTGTTSLSWTEPSINPLYPPPTGYIVYRRATDEFGNTDLFEIATVDEDTKSYTDIEVDASQGVFSYTVASNGLTEPSTQSIEHKTIHLTAQFDSCRNGLSLKWTHYVGWGNRIEKYLVYWGEGLDFDTYSQDTVSGFRNEAFIDSIPVNSQFNLFVEAIKEKSEESDSDIRSRSNLALISTKVAIPPKYMNMDSLIARDNQTELHFSIDALTEYRNFSVVRWEQADSVKSIFSAKNLYQFTDPKTTYFADTSDSWAARSRQFYYKINAYDGCNRLESVSNLSNTMILRLYPRGLSVNLSWDPFYSSQNNNIRYKIYRQAFNPDPLTPDLIFNELNPTENKYVDNLSDFSGQGLLPQFCYFIEAYEELDNLGNHRLSRSRRVCAEVTPEIAMPNAIDPTSQIVYNSIPRNIFAPTISFEADYKLIIYSRWGDIVYEGTNEGWNGRMPNGDLAKEETYIYRLEVYTPSMRSVSKTGYVTVIYGPN